MILQVTGRPPLDARVVRRQELRCTSCGHVFTAPAPPDCDGRRYDGAAAAMIGLLKYGSGLPLSLIYTCELAGVNPYEYLVAVMKHPNGVAAEPGRWLP